MTEVAIQSSTPSFSKFDPRDVPYQYRVLTDLAEFDYALGAHELLLSGSVGSAKSILMAHAAVKHCVTYPGAGVGVCRRSMPDLKATILKKVIQHMNGDFVEGEHFEHNKQSGLITFWNGSFLEPASWADGNYERMRSKEWSCAIIEELTENDDDDKEAYDTILGRVNRIPHVPEAWVIAATNPDSPAHWAYKYFIEPNLAPNKHPSRHVYYSVTTDNRFLKPGYIQKLLGSYDPKMAERMIYGRWVEIAGEGIYHQYARERNYREACYLPMRGVPIRIGHDFNIGEGKPMSAVVSQWDQNRDEFHFFNEAVVDGARTEDIMEELAGRGVFEHRTKFIIHGDASGKHNDTRSKVTDYDIIRKFLANHRRKDGTSIDFEIQVPPANPPVRTRHNTVNGYMFNALKVARLFVYKSCPTLDEGFRLTKIKPGGQYVEDDSKRFQHVTTAAGYTVLNAAQFAKRGTQGSQEL